MNVSGPANTPARITATRRTDTYIYHFI
jgi:hypothetical protein